MLQCFIQKIRSDNHWHVVQTVPALLECFIQKVRSDNHWHVVQTVPALLQCIIQKIRSDNDWHNGHDNVLRALVRLSSLVWDAVKLNPKSMLHLRYCGNRCYNFWGHNCDCSGLMLYHLQSIR